MKPYRKSQKIADHLAVTLRAVNKSKDNLYCWKMEEMGVKYTDCQKNELNVALNKIDEAIAITEKVFTEIIGKQMIREIKRY